MKLLNRLERSLSPLAVTNLTIYLIFFQSLTWLLSQARPDLYQNLVLDRDLVLQGQVWRLVSFIILPPVTNALFLIFGLMLFYVMGTALENQWGTFRYNFFLFVGYLASVGSVMFFREAKGTNSYLMASVLLAFAQLYPDYTIQLYFVLPVKVKYIAMLTWIIYAGALLDGTWATRAQVAAAIANFVLFFHSEIRGGMKSTARKMKVRAKAPPKAPLGEPFHTCVACGANDIVNRTMEFRYCPLCKGTPCYCILHINAHTHR
jgi:membrane associated rhomboid family serine protease